MGFRKILRFIVILFLVFVSQVQSNEDRYVNGKVIYVDGAIVKVEVTKPDTIKQGDRVELYSKTPFGDRLGIGEWKVQIIDKSYVYAVAVKMLEVPTIGLDAEIITTSSRNMKVSNEDAQPYVNKAKELADKYYKDPKQYTKAMSDVLWSAVIENINKAIALGDAEAYFLLAMVYEDGYADYKADMQKMVEYITKSAEHGYVEAQYMLGEMYADGDEVHKDKKKAIYWYQKASSNGHKNATKALKNLKSEYPDFTPELRGKESLNHGVGNENDLFNLLDFEK